MSLRLFHYKNVYGGSDAIISIYKLYIYINIYIYIIFITLTHKTTQYPQTVDHTVNEDFSIAYQRQHSGSC